MAASNRRVAVFALAGLSALAWLGSTDPAPLLARHASVPGQSPTPDLPPKRCGAVPGTYIWILLGPATRPETIRARPGLISSFGQLISDEFTKPGSPSGEVAVILLTTRSDTSVPNRFPFQCVEQTQTPPQVPDPSLCRRVSPLYDPTPCLSRQKDDYEQAKAIVDALNNRVASDIAANTAKLDELAQALAVPPPAGATLDFWGGADLASREMAKRAEGRRLLIGIFEDERDGDATTFVLGCCQLAGAPALFAGFSSDSLKEFFNREGQFRFWVEQVSGASQLCVYEFSESILSLWDCPSGNRFQSKR